MRKPRLKRDPLVIVPYTLFTLALFVLLGVKLITWAHFLVGLAALNLPAAYGLVGEQDAPKSDPPKPPHGILAVLLVAFLGYHVGACGYGATGCKIIDVVHDNCTWIKYLDEQGKEREVQLTREEINAYARQVAAKRAAERDGSAP